MQLCWSHNSSEPQLFSAQVLDSRLLLDRLQYPEMFYGLVLRYTTVRRQPINYMAYKLWQNLL